MVPFSFANHEFLASPNGALFWPSEQALLVADLHLEKASWFATNGQMLPPYDSIATLEALAADLRTTGARSLYCLGDSFHDADGSERLPDRACVQLRHMTASVDWVWIGGNHDETISDPCGGRVVGEAIIGGIALRHEAVAGDDQPEMSGHFHPKLRVATKGRHVSRRCFVMSNSKLILPAYGALTGGLDARHPEILRKVGPNAAALVPIADRLLRFPIAA